MGIKRSSLRTAIYAVSGMAAGALAGIGLGGLLLNSVGDGVILGSALGLAVGVLVDAL